MEKIVILGGYGQTGIQLTSLLLRHTDTQIILTGRNLDKAASLADKFNYIHKTDRVSSEYMDASNPDTLIPVLKNDVKMLIVASSTSRYTYEIATSCLKCGVDYLDVLISRDKLRTLKSLSRRIKSSNRCFITEAGFHPGLPAIMVRYAHRYFDCLEDAPVYSYINFKWEEQTRDTAEEFVEEFNDYRTAILSRGKWIVPGFDGMMATKRVNFGGEVRKQDCYPMYLPEMYQLQKFIPELRNTGFYISGFNPVTNMFVTPLIIYGLKWFGKKVVPQLAQLFTWSMANYSRPPYVTILKLVARGYKKGLCKDYTLTIQDVDGYVLTAAPVVAGIKQYLGGNVDVSGLNIFGHMFDPVKLIDEMKIMGIDISECPVQ